MCQAIQENRMEEQKIREQDGELKKAKETVINFYNLEVDVEKIAQWEPQAVHRAAFFSQIKHVFILLV